MAFSKFRLSAKIKAIPLVLGLLIFVTLGYIYFFSKGTLNIESTPKEVTVYANEKPITLNAKLKTGNYIIKVAKDGFVSFFRNIKINPGITTTISPILAELPKPIEIAKNAAYVTKYKDNIYYLSNGALYKHINNQDQKITSENFGNASKIVFFPDEQNCLVQRGNELFFYEFRRYDLVNQTQKSIATKINDFALSPDQDKIAYTSYPDSGEKLLILSDNNGQNSKIILNLKSLNLNNPKLMFTPDGLKVLIAENDLYLLDLTTLETKKIAEQVSDFLPSPENEYIIVNNTDNNLKIIKFNGELVYNLSAKSNVKQISWIKESNKLVAFDNNTLYLIDLTQSKMIPFQTTVLGAISQIIVIDSNKAYYIANNNFYEIDLLTGWN
ncbi:MAG: PEGA domain-containing protein [Patescibacteria group bacterium]